jgi:uncharacterized membrane protein (UPF0127 family)
MKRFGLSIFVLFSLALAGGGCDKVSDNSLPVTQMQIGSGTYNLEIATTSEEQTVGLMHRDHLDPDHGMIFVFPDEQGRDFWNHDVHFPLDLLFLTSGGDIASIKHMDAWSERDTPSDVPAMYVIELNAGTAAKLGLKVGDHLDIPKDARSPATQPAITPTSLPGSGGYH